MINKLQRHLAFMRYFAISLLLLFTTLPCMAEQENVTAGPYNISFDIGQPKETYSILVSGPKEVESLGGDISAEYNVKIENTTGIIASIRLNKEDDLITLKGKDITSAMKSILQQMGGWDIISAKRNIDGKEGGIASGNILIAHEDVKIYLASYYPDKNTTAFIFSGYPWEEGTLALLRTIQIERNSTGSA